MLAFMQISLQNLDMLNNGEMIRAFGEKMCLEEIKDKTSAHYYKTLAHSRYYIATDKGFSLAKNLLSFDQLESNPYLNNPVILYELVLNTMEAAFARGALGIVTKLKQLVSDQVGIDEWHPRATELYRAALDNRLVLRGQSPLVAAKR